MRTAEEIKKLLKLEVGRTVLTPKGRRKITGVYKFIIATEGKYHTKECFHINDLWVAYCAEQRNEFKPEYESDAYGSLGGTPKRWKRRTVL